MKLADIEDPSVPMAVLNYAAANGYVVTEIVGETNTPDVTAIFNKCLAKAQGEGALEFCLKQILNVYNFKDDSHTWRVQLFVFRKLAAK